MSKGRGQSESWQELGACNERSWLRIAAIAAIGLLGLTVLGLELWCSTVREWLIAHPATVAVGTGLAILIVGALGLEPLLRRIEAHRWRQPSLLVVDNYIFSAERAAQRIRDRLLELVKGLPSPPTSVPSISHALGALVEQDRDQLRDLSDYVREQVDELGTVAMLAPSIIGRYAPHLGAVEDMFKEQHRLGRLAEHIHFLAFVGDGLAQPEGQAFQEFVDEHRQAADRLLTQFVHELHRLRLQVLQARDNADVQ
jgi:hypothetical protein